MELSVVLIGLLVIGYAIFFLVLPFIVKNMLRRMDAIENKLRDLEHAMARLKMPESQRQPSEADATTAEDRQTSMGSKPPTEAYMGDLSPAATTERYSQPVATPGAEPTVSSSDIQSPMRSEKRPGSIEPQSGNWERPPANPIDLDRLKTWLLAGNMVARVGVIILFLGVAFFLKFAIEQGWLAIELRLACSALGGLALVVTGWRLRTRRQHYALILQGGGMGIIYLTVFAAVSFYELLGPAPGLGLMMVLVVQSSTLAVLQDARSLALLAMVGGFLAPVLISSNGSHVALFSYYAVLNVGILGIAWFKAWRELNLVGFIFTFVIGAAWGYAYYRPEYFSTTEPFLILHFLFYVAVPVLFARRQSPKLKGYVDGSLVFGVPLVAVGLQQALVRDFEYGLALSALAAALLYAILATALWKARHAHMRLLTEAFLALAIMFGTLAIPFAVEGRWTGAAWALEGAALVWLGVRQKRLLARLSGLLLQFSAGIALLSNFDLATPHIPVLNSIYLCALIVSFSGLFSGYYLYRHWQILRTEELLVPVLALSWGLAWWFGAGIYEILQTIDPVYLPSANLGFVTTSLAALAALRQPLDWPDLNFPPRILLGLMVGFVAVLLAAPSVHHPMEHGGWLAWPVAFVVQYWLLRRFQKEWPEGLLRYWHLGTFLLLVFMITWEAEWMVGQANLAPTWSYIIWALLPAAVIVALPRLESARPWPLRQFSWSYRQMGLLTLAVLLCVWVLHASLQSGNPQPLPYVPLFNPLELSQWLVLIALLRWNRNNGIKIVVKLSWYSWLLLAFIALNGMIARATHHLGLIPFEPAALWLSPMYQSAVSICWTLVALGIMVTATRLKQRPPWMVGATLLGAVVVKLFLVDLAGIGTLARITSFIVVGLLILLIGYLSPLPPKSKERPVS